MQALIDIARKTLQLDENKIMFSLTKEVEVKDEIIRLNQEEQLVNEGVDTDNVVIGYYSPVTEILSGGRKKAFTHYTLLDTGTFFETFEVIAALKELFIKANGELGKDEDIIDKYGIKILGLTDESKDKFIDFILPKFVEKVEETIGG